ncbi:hypothetical protein [Massilia sp. BJB1822]|uniref:hypothetical protein n=1 Tax=Massilia sp. BJB1822 TaxID=2744470 RepID=UPI001594DA27|nr:hypothetical protein [Massilia sp. BJB1822]NVD97213.1 hypothetical protein [Massilia sp. BJB1822]
MVEFDLDSDGRFQTSLDDLGTDAEIEILQCLSDITSKQYSWDDFVLSHHWIPIALVGEQTYPGAVQLHRFFITTSANHQYQIVGYTFQETIIVCALAL